MDSLPQLEKACEEILSGVKDSFTIGYIERLLAIARERPQDDFYHFAVVTARHILKRYSIPAEERQFAVEKLTAYLQVLKESRIENVLHNSPPECFLGW